MAEMRVGIVGSRRRNNLSDRKIVFDLVKNLVENSPIHKIVIVSGGCPKGADKFAAEMARIFKLDLTEFPVDTKDVKNRGDFRKEAFARNKLIAGDSDFLYALVHSDRTGGTENTIKHMIKMKKPVCAINDLGECKLVS